MTDEPGLERVPRAVRIAPSRESSVDSATLSESSPHSFGYSPTPILMQGAVRHELEKAISGDLNPLSVFRRFPVNLRSAIDELCRASYGVGFQSISSEKDQRIVFAAVKAAFEGRK